MRVNMNDISMFFIMFAGVLGLIGIIFFIIGIIMVINRKKKEKECTSKTYGKVKDVARHQTYNSDGGYSYTWHPVFEYNIGELKFIKESIYGSSEAKYAIGQDVEIYYNPEDYNEYYVVGDAQSKNLGVIFTIVGIVVIIIACFSAILIH